MKCNFCNRVIKSYRQEIDKRFVKTHVLVWSLRKHLRFVLTYCFFLVTNFVKELRVTVYL